MYASPGGALLKETYVKISKKLYDSTKWSLSGLVYAYKNELAFRLEVFAMLVITPLAIYLATDLNQFLWLLNF